MGNPMTTNVQGELQRISGPCSLSGASTSSFRHEKRRSLVHWPAPVLFTACWLVSWRFHCIATANELPRKRGLVDNWEERSAMLGRRPSDCKAIVGRKIYGALLLLKQVEQEKGGQEAVCQPSPGFSGHEAGFNATTSGFFKNDSII
jgi:hypothetical protein